MAPSIETETFREIVEVAYAMATLPKLVNDPRDSIRLTLEWMTSITFDKDECLKILNQRFPLGL